MLGYIAKSNPPSAGVFTEISEAINDFHHGHFQDSLSKATEIVNRLNRVSPYCDVFRELSVLTELFLMNIEVFARPETLELGSLHFNEPAEQNEFAQYSTVIWQFPEGGSVEDPFAGFTELNLENVDELDLENTEITPVKYEGVIDPHTFEAITNVVSNSIVHAARAVNLIKASEILCHYYLKLDEDLSPNGLTDLFHVFSTTKTYSEEVAVKLTNELEKNINNLTLPQLAVVCEALGNLGIFTSSLCSHIESRVSKPPKDKHELCNYIDMAVAMAIYAPEVSEKLLDHTLKQLSKMDNIIDADSRLTPHERRLFQLCTFFDISPPEFFKHKAINESKGNVELNRTEQLLYDFLKKHFNNLGYYIEPQTTTGTFRTDFTVFDSEQNKNPVAVIEIFGEKFHSVRTINDNSHPNIVRYTGYDRFKLKCLDKLGISAIVIFAEDCIDIQGGYIYDIDFAKLKIANGIRNYHFYPLKITEEDKK